MKSNMEIAECTRSINSLDMRFKHHTWFKGSKLTVRQFIEWAAQSGDICLIRKSERHTGENLISDIRYASFLSDGHCKYKLSEDAMEYYQIRKSFWKDHQKKMNQEYEASWLGKERKIEEWYAFEQSEALKIPEYASFWNAYKASK